MPDSIASKSAIINSNAEVHVEVSIDEEGRVVDARVPNPPANMNETLVSQSVAAAKQWKFEPAQLRGKNIPSDHTITFLFHPRS
jgi:TonB family protein